MKSKLWIIFCLISNLSFCQLEMELIVYANQFKLIKECGVKEKIVLRKIADEYIEIRREHYSEDGKLDTLKIADPRSYSAGRRHLNEEKKWDVLHFKYTHDEQIRVDMKNNRERRRPYLMLDSIIAKFNKPDFTIDTLGPTGNRVVTKYDNSNNIYSHYYVSKDDENIFLHTKIRYDNNYNIQSKTKYTTQTILGGQVRYNASQVTYYYYNENLEMVKEVEENLGNEYSDVTLYMHNENNLMRERSKYGIEEKYEYVYYKE